MLFTVFLLSVVGAMSQPKKDPAIGVVQQGEISLNDSEITLLINSSFEFVEGFEANITDVDNSTDTSEEVERKRPATRFHKIRPSLPAGRCRKYTTKEKYAMLEDIGSRNQLLMADSPEEASRGFVHFYPTENKATARLNDAVETVDPKFCNAQCELIKKSLTDIEKSKEVTAVLNDAGFPEVDEGLAGCSLQLFKGLGNCSEMGEEASWGYEHLCSECRGIYLMSENCFPKYFNAVKCNDKELGCIFNSFSNKAHGECQMETLSQQVLRNKGNSNCEDWVIEAVQIPVACQCMLSTSSWLRSHPPKEL